MRKVELSLSTLADQVGVCAVLLGAPRSAGSYTTPRGTNDYAHAYSHYLLSPSRGLITEIQLRGV